MNLFMLSDPVAWSDVDAYILSVLMPRQLTRKVPDDRNRTYLTQKGGFLLSGNDRSGATIHLQQ